MKTDTGKKYCTIYEALFMLLFSMAKFAWFYHFKVRPDNQLLALGSSLLILILIYTVFNVFVFKSIRYGRLVMHELIAMIILADTMYYSYFNILPSIGDVNLIGVLPDIGRSIASVFKPVYLMLFIDIPFFIWFNKRKEKDRNYRRMRFAALVLSLAAIVNVFFNFGMTKHMDSMSYFNKYGLWHYHISQLVIHDDEKSVTGSITDLDLLSQNIYDNKVKKNYKGIAEGRNVIVIQVEALQNFVINRSYEGQEITPNLNKLIKNNSIYYDRYYQQIGKGGTSDAEFSSLNSLIPSGKSVSYEEYVNNDLYGLPKILKDNGYSTMAFHGYKPDFWNRDTMYPAEGFDKFISQEELDQKDIVGMGVSDSSFFKQVTNTLKSSKQPYFAYCITLSSHHPYGMPKSLSSIKLNEKHQNTLFGRYLNAINYTDKALGEFIEELKQEGLYDNTIIAIYGDHHGLNSKDPQNEKFMTEYLGHHYEFDEMFNVPLIVHIPGSGLSQVNKKAGGQIDLTPTLLNLLGLENRKGNMLGDDLNNIEKGFVALKFMVADGSYVDDQNIFLIDYGKNFEQAQAWQTKTKEKVDINSCREGYERALKEIGESEYILKNDLARKTPEQQKSSKAENTP